MKNLNTIKTVNSVTLLGKIAREPEQKTITSGRKLSVFSLQTQSDDKYVSSEFHNIVAWDELADITRVCKLSDVVYIEGSIKTRNFVNKKNIKVFKTEIIAHKIIVLSSEKSTDMASDEEKTFFTASKSDFYTSS
ncbi:TPA: single-stranded DNA-binding protein [Candidatus Gracilibacteria bacterium]|nr:single-stranded DNA-binding protein [Candidatus Gracilibacteria bacterium]HIQ57803.1 single-stranded DNA-binding protein [Candidatus Gracilibacteria bacterium]